jgi:hypothetical protein
LHYKTLNTGFSSTEALAQVDELQRQYLFISGF